MRVQLGLRWRIQGRAARRWTRRIGQHLYSRERAERAERASLREHVMRQGEAFAHALLAGAAERGSYEGER